jgi:hypothetical protein
MTLAVLFSAGYAGFETSDSLERLQTTAIWFGGIYSFVAICQWYTGGGKVLWLIQTPYDSDIAGTFGNRDHYAALIALLLPVALARIVAGRHSGLIAAACAGLMFASVLACGSRAGTLVVCAEALIFVGVACFGRRRNVPAAAFISRPSHAPYSSLLEQASVAVPSPKRSRLRDSIVANRNCRQCACAPKIHVAKHLRQSRVLSNNHVLQQQLSAYGSRLDRQAPVAKRSIGRRQDWVRFATPAV